MQQRQLQGGQNLGMIQTIKGGSERYNKKDQGCTTKQGEMTLRRSESDKLIRNFQTDQTLSYGSERKFKIGLTNTVFITFKIN